MLPQHFQFQFRSNPDIFNSNSNNFNSKFNSGIELNPSLLYSYLLQNMGLYNPCNISKSEARISTTVYGIHRNFAIELINGLWSMRSFLNQLKCASKSPTEWGVKFSKGCDFKLINCNPKCPTKTANFNVVYIRRSALMS